MSKVKTLINLIKNCKVERLHGLTNQVFKIAYHNEEICMRLPGIGTENYIDRFKEAQNAQLAANAKIAPKIIFTHPKSGILITQYIANAITMTPKLFRERLHSPARAALALKQLHTRCKKFQQRFEAFSKIDQYLKVLYKKKIDPPKDYFIILNEAKKISSDLKLGQTPPVCCHCDPLCENFLDNGKRMWIVDWEYSGLNDPLWDLASLSLEANFDPLQEEKMMRAYFPDETSNAKMEKIAAYKILSDLFWTVWALIQHTNGHYTIDYLSYANKRYERCCKSIKNKFFAKAR